MNILVITPGYLEVPAINGGAVENLIDTIVTENEKYKKAKFKIITISNKINIDKCNKENIEYIHINNKSFLFKIKRILCFLINKIPLIYIGNSFIREVVKTLKNNKQNFDVVIIENNPLYILKIKKYIKVPIILHLHNDYLNNKTKLNKKVYSQYDKVVTVSNYIGNRVKTIDAKSNKIITLYNGIDIKRFKQEIPEIDKKQIRDRYRINENDFVFLYTGRIIPQKGVKQMVQAFNNVNETIKNIKLLIVGSSAFKNAKKSKYIKELEKLVSKNNENIIFTGYVDYNEINKIYKSCQVQIVPSLWGEALANTVIEGMAAGIPQILNNIGGIPELLKKETALFCDEKNLISSLEKNMIELINNKEKFLNLKNINVENSNIFDQKQFYDNYIDIMKLKL